MGGDVADQLAEGVGGQVSAVPAAGVGVESGADQAEHGGERDQVRVDAGQRGGTGRDGGDHVVHEQECPGFLPGESLGLAAQTRRRRGVFSSGAGTRFRFAIFQHRDGNFPGRCFSWSSRWSAAGYGGFRTAAAVRVTM